MTSRFLATLTRRTVPKLRPLVDDKERKEYYKQLNARLVQPCRNQDCPLFSKASEVYYPPYEEGRSTVPRKSPDVTIYKS